jgi:hypothetical protein
MLGVAHGGGLRVVVGFADGREIAMADFNFFVDSEKGRGDWPGTADKPLRSLEPLGDELTARTLAMAIYDALRQSGPDATMVGRPDSSPRTFLEGSFNLRSVARRAIEELKKHQ